MNTDLLLGFLCQSCNSYIQNWFKTNIQIKKKNKYSTKQIIIFIHTRLKPQSIQPIPKCHPTTSLTYKISCFNSDLVNMLIHPLVIYAYPKTDYVHSRRIHPSHTTSVLFPPIHETLNYTYLDGVVQRRDRLNIHWNWKWIFWIIRNSSICESIASTW